MDSKILNPQFNLQHLDLKNPIHESPNLDWIECIKGIFTLRKRKIISEQSLSFLINQVFTYKMENVNLVSRTKQGIEEECTSLYPLGINSTRTKFTYIPLISFYVLIFFLLCKKIFNKFFRFVSLYNVQCRKNN